jgi:starch phosphorylase
MMATATAERRGTAESALDAALLRHVTYSLGERVNELGPDEILQALALAVRDPMLETLLATEQRYQQAGAKRVYYLSLEFLIGRSLRNNLMNLGLWETARSVLGKLGFDLAGVEDREIDAALGNGGLGRLAACFLDSIATLGLPGFGYGINYEFGMFKQDIRNGEQVERPDNWRTFSSPWMIERPQEAILVPLQGRVEHTQDRFGNYNPMWLDWKIVIGVPHDMPVVGYGGRTVNYLRLYSARASQDVDISIFNQGDYLQAVHQQVMSETISKVLYPSDTVAAGRELRLTQEYFLVACAVRDIIRRYKSEHKTFDQFPDKVAIQLNDTHPSLTVAELMRTLVDENDLDWDNAWEITTAVCGYTNHTLLPEALEKWPVSLFEKVLPRHLEVIYEINRRFLDRVSKRWPGDTDRLKRMSLIDEGETKQVRMANLAITGSHSINGVAAVHSELVKTELVPDFYALWPERFNNKTNGVTQRRWLLSANPGLAGLITEAIGDRWITDLDRLRDLERFAGDSSFQERFIAINRRNKDRVGQVIQDTVGETVDCDSLFDIHAKRIHEYKRQLLNVLHIVHEYVALADDGQIPAQPRTYIFAGKSAPGYRAAKQIIRLINDVADLINRDSRAHKHMKVAFVPDYRVTLAEVLMPAADLSEQISTAGTEASGTGNMKFALNGCLTIGTLDGANIEIREEVGAENIFIFGLTVPQVRELKAARSYRPWDIYQRSAGVRRVMDAFKKSRFCPTSPGRHDWVFQKLLADNEQYLHLADLESYLQTHEAAGRLFCDRAAWAAKAILNVARIGKFSSDRTIREYAKDIWTIRPVL